jgi:CMP-N-acetylneuraminic acid synthetase
MLMKFFIIIKHKSERIKGKSFLKIGKYPLWEHFLRKFKSNDEVFIDTDSSEIYIKGKKKFKNFVFYKRDKKFIEFENEGEKSPVLLMIKNFLLKYVKNDDDIVVTTHITSPFIKRSQFIEASKKIKNYEFVHSVTSHNEFAWVKKNNYVKKINFGKIVKKTQNLDPILFSNGAFFIFKKKNFLKYNNRLGKKNFFYNLDFPESLELDNNKDVNLMRAILK